MWIWVVWLILGLLLAMGLGKLLSIKNPKYYESYKPKGKSN